MSGVLVTGASGFLGRHIVSSLIQRGLEVHTLSRSHCGDTTSSIAGSHIADLRDRSAAKRILERVRPDGLIHLAWVTEHGAYWNSADNLDWLAASIQLARDFQASGCSIGVEKRGNMHRSGHFAADFL